MDAARAYEAAQDPDGPPVPDWEKMLAAAVLEAWADRPGCPTGLCFALLLIERLRPAVTEKLIGNELYVRGQRAAAYAQGYQAGAAACQAARRLRAVPSAG